MLVNIKPTDKKLSSSDYDIIILAGQSNAVGYGKGDVDFTPSENVEIIYRNEEGKRFGKCIWNRHKFYFHKAEKRLSAFTGFYLYFGKDYEKELLESGRKLLFLRAAVGATGFVDKRWGLEDDLYTDGVETAKKLLQVNDKNRIVGILWHQGETDVLGGSTQEYYHDKLKALVDGFRSELGMPNLPFIAGDMVQEWSVTQPNAPSIKNATLQVVEEVGTSGYVSSEGLRGNEGDDCIHFSSAANEVFGKRYFEEFKKVIGKN